MSVYSDFTPITLTNGAQVPVGSLTSYLNLLQSHLGTPDQEWDVVYFLRELCLGRSIEPEQQRAVAGVGLLESDGTVHPLLRDVVLASIKGRGRVLTLELPYTDVTDEAMCEFIRHREYLRHMLPDPQAEELFRTSPGEQSEDRLAESRGQTPAPTHLRDPNTFLKRILDRKPPDADPPPSPPHG